MRFERVPAEESLKPYVRHFWHVEGQSTVTIKALADGCPGIVFQQADGGTLLNQEKKLSTVFLYGQTVKPVELTAVGKFRMIGLYFHPHVMKPIFGLDANELTDTCLDLTLLPDAGSRNLADRLLNAPAVEAQLGLLSSYLLGFLRANGQRLRVDEILQSAVRHLVSTSGSASMRELQRDFGLSERTFERRFTQYVGIPPKLFARICRFQATLHQLTRGDYELLSDAAYDNGYADQSHFIRSFREFSNLSPLEFRRHPGLLAPQQ
jgi:AraC-like DNA-binding protein